MLYAHYRSAVPVLHCVALYKNIPSSAHRPYLLIEVLFCQAEVPQLDMQLVVSEDIPRLDIAMQDTFTNIPELELCTLTPS
jgi:hypothetical protein